MMTVRQRRWVAASLATGLVLLLVFIASFVTGLVLLGHEAFAKPLEKKNDEVQEIRLEHAKAAARVAVDSKVSEWTGEKVDAAAVQRIIELDTRFD